MALVYSIDIALGLEKGQIIVLCGFEKRINLQFEMPRDNDESNGKI